MDDVTAERQRVWLLAAGGVALAVGMVVVVLITVGTAPGADWSVPFQLILFMLAAIAVSSILGFIFGVPRARTGDAAPASEPTPATTTTTMTVTTPTTTVTGAKRADPRTSRFEANSNLEQISDWLTKILVGAGLVQLASLPGFLKDLGTYLGTPLGTPFGPTVAVAAVLYGFGIGFLFSYLWARLRLRVLLEKSEVEAEKESREKAFKVQLAAAQGLGQNAEDSPREIQRAARRTAQVASAATRFDPVLWVDDRPANNTALVDAMRELGIEVTLSPSTADAMAQLRAQPFGLVITDLGRTEDNKRNNFAGLDLVKAIVAEFPSHPPIFVYAAARGLKEAEKLQAAGAAFVTASPSAIFERAVRTVSRAS